MEIYLVGGAVRDRLLGSPVSERDWVVVGSTPEEMLKKGFKPVGKDFPVFLHPETKEEYALARTERKSGKGYKGFTFHATPDVSLEEDLKRRDLTINAIAQTNAGKLIDPFNGKQDLEKKLLRHISPAFAEDPVRILRVARFAARFPEFSVDAETNKLMQKMVENGEVDVLVSERVWKELERALSEPAPKRFFEVLEKCNALEKLFPKIKNNKNTLIMLDKAKNTNEALIRFAALTQPLSEKEIKAFAKRYKLPREHQDLAILVSNYFTNYESCLKDSADKLLALLERSDAFRRQARFQRFLQVCEICSGHQTKQKTKQLKIALKQALAVSTKPLMTQGLQGEAFARALRQLRVEAIKGSQLSL